MPGHGRAALKRINVVGPRTDNGLDVAGYGQSGPEKSWTGPSLLEMAMDPDSRSRLR